jgi:hypothetical protein
MVERAGLADQSMIEIASREPLQNHPGTVMASSLKATAFFTAVISLLSLFIAPSAPAAIARKKIRLATYRDLR